MKAFLSAALILAGVLAAKLPFLNLPLLGHFGSYQRTTGMMASMMDWSDPVTLLMPRLTVLLNGEGALHLLYYPFASLFTSGFFTLFGGSLEFWGRFQAALFSGAAALVLGLMARRLYEGKTWLWTMLFASAVPMIMITGISLQNEAFALCTLCAAFWLLVRPGGWSALGAGLMLSLAITARQHFAVVFPAAFWLLFFREKKIRDTIVFLIALALPAAAWIGWVWHLSQTETAVYSSIFSQLGESRILIKDLLLSREYIKRILEILWGPTMLIPLAPFIFTAISRVNKRQFFLLLWAAGALSLIVLLPQKINDHPFYLIAAIPPLVTLASTAWTGWFIKEGRALLKSVILLFFFVFSARYFLPPALSAASDHKGVQMAAAIVDREIPADARIISIEGNTHEFFYYTRRTGWLLSLKQAYGDNKKKGFHNRQSTTGADRDPIKWLETKRGAEGADFLVVLDKKIFHHYDDFRTYIEEHFLLQYVDENLFIFNLGEEL